MKGDQEESDGDGARVGNRVDERGEEGKEGGRR